MSQTFNKKPVPSSDYNPLQPAAWHSYTYWSPSSWQFSFNCDSTDETVILDKLRFWLHCFLLGILHHNDHTAPTENTLVDETEWQKWLSDQIITSLDLGSSNQRHVFECRYLNFTGAHFMSITYMYIHIIINYLMTSGVNFYMIVFYFNFS